ncbi:glycerol-3-phosphate dehydrogenase [Eikenella longinqua]|uniref:Glycerol-3-phosphate dehydrogenase [NAD(P)+] n=1 Tax=Eikenella longinqua TaxID=1795827 RepID=A0A1A9RVR4_9NEIS|nr:NAD(P)H-dependent glycerol-3-phosphate dehydrogenase [Eikenella longinqua]OAM26377.1 glycerol-3-phosphate dehydrogenase [Eikenella longinqua]
MQICIIGAGAWGTALAIHFAQNGQQVSLWTREREHATAMRAERSNTGYLKNFPFPATLSIADTPPPRPDLVIIATPTAGLRGSLQTLRQWGWSNIPLLTACKGFEQGSGLLPHQVARQELPDNSRIGILSGPSFAQELAQQLPCAVTLASSNLPWVESLAAELSSAVLRLYANDDMVGVGVGGAVKNVMAIAVGIADGLQYGLNARAALMTRGLAEINRLALALGAKQTTLMGLAGMGDLILTCTGALSRNRQVGLKLAEGKPLPTILAELGHVAEGVYTIREAGVQAAKLGIDMPITRILNELLDGKINVGSVAERLMLREIRVE